MNNENKDIYDTFAKKTKYNSSPSQALLNWYLLPSYYIFLKLNETLSHWFLEVNEALPNKTEKKKFINNLNIFIVLDFNRKLYIKLHPNIFKMLKIF